MQNLHSKEGASRTRGLGERVRHEMSRSKIISRQWPLVVHLSRGLVGWSQVVWLGNGHKAVTVQGPRRPLLRSVLCSILILGLLPPPPVVDQPLTSSPTSQTTGPQRPTFPTTALKRPGCSQNCSSSLSHLLSARISTFASINSCRAPTQNIKHL